ncbi:MAG TPA: DUF429 domain-containing protein [Chitinophagaceae bacterium]|nr:DUF429 domain-containing protein [Chitinophagaceae bacterium]HAN39984.1 DUF429 domain-containing protein [Chitinophagaceae bacterium]
MYIGVDGCKAGWLAVDFYKQQFQVASLFSELTENLSTTESKVLVDIPIGLPSSNEGFNKDRDCDLKSRSLLQRRKSSVFPVPVREALGAGIYEKASLINKKILGKGLSKQSYAIMDKIKQVDDFIINQIRFESSKNPQIVVFESHPEIAFWGLNGGVEMHFAKRTTEGQKERIYLLDSIERGALSFFNEVLKRTNRSHVAADDIIDAICLSITCNLLHKKREKAATVNGLKQEDALGVIMDIHYVKM